MNTVTPNRFQNRNGAPRGQKPDMKVIKENKALKQELATLKKGFDGLQAAQEIKYLKGKLKTAEDNVTTVVGQCMRAREALVLLGVPDALVTTILKGEAFDARLLPAELEKLAPMFPAPTE